MFLHILSVFFLLPYVNGQGLFDMFGYGGAADPFGMFDPFYGAGGGGGHGFGTATSAPLPDPAAQDARLTMAEEQMSEVMGESPRNSPERQRIDRLIKASGGRFTGDAASLNYLVQDYLMTTPGSIQPVEPQPRPPSRGKSGGRRQGRRRNRNQGRRQQAGNGPNGNGQAGTSMQPPMPKPTRPAGRVGAQAAYAPNPTQQFNNQPQPTSNTQIYQGQANNQMYPPSTNQNYQGQAPPNTNNMYKSQQPPASQAYQPPPTNYPSSNNPSYQAFQQQMNNQNYPAQPPINNQNPSLTNQMYQPQPFTNQKYQGPPPTNQNYQAPPQANQNYQAPPQRRNQNGPSQPPMNNQNYQSQPPPQNVYQGQPPQGNNIYQGPPPPNNNNYQGPPASNNRGFNGQKKTSMYQAPNPTRTGNSPRGQTQGNYQAPQTSKSNNIQPSNTRSRQGVAADRLKRIQGRISSVNNQLQQARQSNNMAQVNELTSQLEALNGVKHILTGGSAKSNTNKMETIRPAGKPKSPRPQQQPPRQNNIPYGPPKINRNNPNTLNNVPRTNTNFQETNVGGGKFAQTWKHTKPPPPTPQQNYLNPNQPAGNINIQPYQNVGPTADPYAPYDHAGTQNAAPYDQPVVPQNQQQQAMYNQPAPAYDTGMPIQGGQANPQARPRGQRRQRGQRRNQGRRRANARARQAAPATTPPPTGPPTSPPQLGDTKFVRGVEYMLIDADGYDTFQWRRKSKIPPSQLDHLPQNQGQEQPQGQQGQAAEGAAAAPA